MLYVYVYTYIYIYIYKYCYCNVLLGYLFVEQHLETIQSCLKNRRTKQKNTWKPTPRVWPRPKPKGQTLRALLRFSKCFFKYEYDT